MNLRVRGLSYLMRIIPVVTVSWRGLALAFGRLVVDEAALPVSASMGILSSVLGIGTSDVVLVPGGLG